MHCLITALIIILLLCCIVLNLEKFKDAFTGIKGESRDLEAEEINSKLFGIRDKEASEPSKAAAVATAIAAELDAEPAGIPKINEPVRYDVADPIHEMYDVIEEDVNPDVIVVDQAGERYMCDVIGDCGDLDSHSFDQIRMAPATRRHVPVKGG